LISFGGCILTSFGILVPMKASYSSFLVMVVVRTIFCTGSSRLDKQENKKSMPHPTNQRDSKQEEKGKVKQQI
jgi:hypothetical protein